MDITLQSFSTEAKPDFNSTLTRKFRLASVRATPVPLTSIIHGYTDCRTLQKKQWLVTSQYK